VVQTFLTLRSTNEGHRTHRSVADVPSELHALLRYGCRRGLGACSSPFRATLPNFWNVNGRVGAYLAHYDNREARDGALFEGTGRRQLPRHADREDRSSEGRVIVFSGFIHQPHEARLVGVRATSPSTCARLSYIEIDLISDASWSYGDPRWVDTEPKHGHVAHVLLRRSRLAELWTCSCVEPGRSRLACRSRRTRSSISIAATTEG